MKAFTFTFRDGLKPGLDPFEVEHHLTWTECCFFEPAGHVHELSLKKLHQGRTKRAKPEEYENATHYMLVPAGLAIDNDYTVVFVKCPKDHAPEATNNQSCLQRASKNVKVRGQNHLVKQEMAFALYLLRPGDTLEFKEYDLTYVWDSTTQTMVKSGNDRRGHSELVFHSGEYIENPR